MTAERSEDLVDLNAGVPEEVLNLVRWLPDDFGIVAEVDRNLGRCIEAARLCTPALRRAGVDCRAVACDVLYANPLAWQLVLDGAPRELWPDDAWTAGCRCDDLTQRVSKTDGSRSRFNGHVVIVGEGWLCDLTAEQFHRPEKGIYVPAPLVTGFPPGAETETLTWNLVDAETGNGTVAAYWLRPEVAAWRLTPAWRQDVGRDEVDALAAVCLGADLPRVETLG